MAAQLHSSAAAATSRRYLLLALFVGFCAEAGRISRFTEELSVRDGVQLDKNLICGSKTISDALAQGDNVDNIRGIQWNAIFKTAKGFVDNKQHDMDDLKAESKELQQTLHALIAERSANQVPELTESKVKEVVSAAVRTSFGNVYTAQDKLCWAGSMEPNEQVNKDFRTSLEGMLEKSQTNIDFVQQACLSLLIKKDVMVNMCDELCNMLGTTTAQVSAATARVRSLTDLSERIDMLQSRLDVKMNDVKGMQRDIDECGADQELLSQHKNELNDLSGDIKQEKIKLFMAWNALTGAEKDLTALTSDNEKLDQQSQDLNEALADAAKEKNGIADALAKLKEDENALSKEMATQRQEASNIDEMVAAAGSASEVVIEFKAMLSNMLLVWVEYYKKSVVEPIRKIQEDFPNASSPGIAELRSRSSETAEAVSKFCASDKTKEVLAGVTSVPELPLICDKQLESSEELADSMETVVETFRGKQLDMLRDMEAALSKVERAHAYDGAELTGVRAEVEGVWRASAYFNETAFHASYLRGWKALDSLKDAAEHTTPAPTIAGGWRAFAKRAKQALRVSSHEDLDGRWMRLCARLDLEFKAAVKASGEAVKDLAKLDKSFQNVKDDVAKVADELQKAEFEHEIAEDSAKDAKDQLAKMRADEEAMQKNIVELAENHEASLEALKAAESVFVSTHKDAVSKP